MNRWTGTGHLTKDPKFLETDGGTAICTLRIAVKRAGKQGNDGYFDVKCFEGQAHACADYLKAGREVAIDGRLLFDEFQTQDGSYASRVYIVAERVEYTGGKYPVAQALGLEEFDFGVYQGWAPAGEVTEVREQRV